MEDIELVQILWDYMQMNHKLDKKDCMIVLGTCDTSVVNYAVELYFKGLADKIFFAGGLGKITSRLWHESEADKFAKIAIELGVPKEKIYIENKSTNTGDNFRFTKKIIEENNMNINSCIIVCKPYDEKRAYAAFRKIMPEYDGIIASKKMTCREYYEYFKNDENINDEWIHVLVGDVQRMDIFAQKGWQIEMDVPDYVWDAYNELVKRGYNKYIYSEN